MPYDRIKIEVYVDLVGTAGTFHTAENAADIVQNILDKKIARYHPIVSVPTQDV